MKKGLFAVVLLVAVAAFVYACGGNGGGGGGGSTAAGSCNQPGEGVCIEYPSNLSPVVLAAAQEQCDTANGETWSNQGCAVAGALGTCTVDVSGLVEVPDGGVATGQARVIALPTFPGGAIAAQGACVAGSGTWAPAGGTTTDGGLNLPDGGFSGPFTFSFIGSCDDRDIDGTCTENYFPASEAAETEADCDGVWSSTALCPTTGRAGTCHISVGGMGTDLRFYLTDYTVTQAQTGCFLGAFTPN